MDALDILRSLGLSAALGLLVGLQRERVASPIGGIRTFPLIAVLGTVCGLLANAGAGPWVVAAGLLALGALVIGSGINARNGGQHPGITSEVAALVMYGIGAWLVLGLGSPPQHERLKPVMMVAVVASGALALLLHHKKPMHEFVHRMGSEDVSAIMRFVLISLVILPLLPDKAYGPFAVLNPREIWLMVVLIVGISLGGYVLYKLVGARAGTLLGGALGGLISSTATTVSFARRAKGVESATGLATVVIIVASAVAFGRVLALIAAVAPRTVAQMVLPVSVLLVAMGVIALGMWWRWRHERAELPAQSNPAELKPALIFAGLYAVIVLVVAASKEWFGTGALYVVALISGTTDMDAMTLSAARLVESGSLPAEQGWRLIVVAALSNLVFKGGAAAALGGRRLGIRVGIAFALVTVVGVLLLFLWPDGAVATAPVAVPAP